MLPLAVSLPGVYEGDEPRSDRGLEEKRNPNHNITPRCHVTSLSLFFFNHDVIVCDEFVDVRLVCFVSIGFGTLIYAIPGAIKLQW
jgi:hypothetical protein